MYTALKTIFRTSVVEHDKYSLIINYIFSNKVFCIILFLILGLLAIIFLKKLIK